MELASVSMSSLAMTSGQAKNNETSLRPERTLRANILRSFLIFQLLMSLPGVFFVASTIVATQDYLQVSLLRSEVAAFKKLYELNPDAPLPSSASIVGYLGLEHVPDRYQSFVTGLEPGVFEFRKEGRQEDELEHEMHIMIEPLKEGGPLLYFVSKIPADQSDRSGEIRLLYLVLIYFAITGLLGLWWARFISRKISKPLELIDEGIRNSKTDDPTTNLSAISGGGEIGMIARTLDDKNRRIAAFIQRERNVMRNVSHELRTPITILKSSLAIIKERRQDHRSVRVDSRMFEKIERVSRDLEAMIEAFLWLGREQQDCEEIADCSACAERAISDHAYIAEAKKLELEVDIERQVSTPCKDQVFYIAIANLVRNAFNHANSGVVSIRLQAGMFEVRNEDPGLDPRILDYLTEPNVKGDDGDGFGLGLHIVQQICDRMSWTLKMALDRRPGGFTATINF
ncbi:MAG: HAMP domain-containing sensor histidine kinase [Pseudomonadota bacterium]